MAKILLVEDDNNLREIYEARLMAEGYTIVSARDGEEALVVAKAEHPDLVISDVMMPKISGFEMLDILRNTEGLQHVKVIMLTALGQSEDQKRADSLGADRYLVKSQVTLEDIVNVSQHLLQEAGAIAAPEPEVAPAPAAEIALPEPVAPAVTPAAVQPEPAVIPLAAPPTEPSETPAEPTMALPSESEPPVQAPAEPVASDPVVAVSQSEPVTAPEPAAMATDQPQTSAQEEATVEQQIESFVSAQSGTAPAEVPPSAAPVAVEPETTAPEQSQDEVVAEAAQNLSGEPALMPAPEPVATEPPAPSDDNETTTHKKVIKPLGDSDQNKKSLDQLLAEEASKQATPQAPAQPAVAPPPATPPASASDFDPNSIAL